MGSNIPISVLLSKISDNVRKMTGINARLVALSEENDEHIDAIKTAITSGKQSFGDRWKDLLFLWVRDLNFPALWFFERLQAATDGCINDFLLVEKKESVRVRFGGRCSQDDFRIGLSYYLLLLKAQPIIVDLQERNFKLDFSLGGKVDCDGKAVKITEEMMFSNADVYSIFFSPKDGKNKTDELSFSSIDGFPLYKFIFGSKKIIDTFVPDFDALLTCLGIVIDRENGQLKTNTLSLF